ncbi:MAG TPA: hypothetical protein VKZ59_01195, partial [Acidobacteriota bacterium]|nr:hypothetical protein [Acidobacteriota bacterium]
MRFTTLPRLAAAFLALVLLFPACSSEPPIEDQTRGREEIPGEKVAPRPARNVLLITLDTLRAD